MKWTERKNGERKQILNECRGWVEILNKHQATDFKQRKPRILAVTQATDLGNGSCHGYGKWYK